MAVDGGGGDGELGCGAYDEYVLELQAEEVGLAWVLDPMVR